MDVPFNKVALLAIVSMTVAAFFMYRVSVIRKNGAVAYFAQLFRQMKCIGTTLSGFIGALVGLLAASGDTSEKEDDATEGDLTGVYNFRTRKYDNGTDPYGWYEEDL
jgi:hypothetical protein